MLRFVNVSPLTFTQELAPGAAAWKAVRSWSCRNGVVGLIHQANDEGHTMTMTATRTNRYAAPCADCGVWVREEAGVLSKSATGKWETRHDGECPAPVAKGTPAKNAEPGYYVRPADGRAVVVVQSKRNADRTYGKILTYPADGSRPSWDYVAGAGYSVADLRPMTAADAAAMGLAHGYCIKCCAELGGETLSAQVSALIGYGETCAKNLGWPYPRGVKAQREFIAERGR